MWCGRQRSERHVSSTCSVLNEEAVNETFSPHNRLAPRSPQQTPPLLWSQLTALSALWDHNALHRLASAADSYGVTLTIQDRSGDMFNHNTGTGI